MGRATGGVIGMKLRKGDEVIAIDVADDEADLLVITENGYGKRTRVAEYPRKGRGTMGVLTIRLVEARGAIVGALVVGPRQEILLITESGTVQRTGGRRHLADGPRHAGRDRPAPARRRSHRSVALVAEQPDDDEPIDDDGSDEPPEAYRSAAHRERGVLGVDRTDRKAGSELEAREHRHARAAPPRASGARRRRPRAVACAATRSTGPCRAPACRSLAIARRATARRAPSRRASSPCASGAARSWYGSALAQGAYTRTPCSSATVRAAAAVRGELGADGAAGAEPREPQRDERSRRARSPSAASGCDRATRPSPAPSLIEHSRYPWPAAACACARSAQASQTRSTSCDDSSTNAVACAGEWITTSCAPSGRLERREEVRDDADTPSRRPGRAGRGSPAASDPRARRRTGTARASDARRAARS